LPPQLAVTWRFLFCDRRVDREDKGRRDIPAGEPKARGGQQ
jgi:hypothetical protein